MAEGKKEGDLEWRENEGSSFSLHLLQSQLDKWTIHTEDKNREKTSLFLLQVDEHKNEAKPE